MSIIRASPVTWPRSHLNTNAGDRFGWFCPSAPVANTGGYFIHIEPVLGPQSHLLRFVIVFVHAMKTFVESIFKVVNRVHR